MGRDAVKQIFEILENDGNGMKDRRGERSKIGVDYDKHTYFEVKVKKGFAQVFNTDDKPYAQLGYYPGGGAMYSRKGMPLSKIVQAVRDLKAGKEPKL